MSNPGYTHDPYAYYRQQQPQHAQGGYQTNTYAGFGNQTGSLASGYNSVGHPMASYQTMQGQAPHHGHYSQTAQMQSGPYNNSAQSSYPYSSSQPPYGGQNQPSQTSPRMCEHCGAIETSEWRREPGTHRLLCNACGLYYKARKEHRPSNLIDAGRQGQEESHGDEYYVGPQCSHCNTRKTPTWRRDNDGNKVCNACGMYQRTHGTERPLDSAKPYRPRRAKDPSSHNTRA